MSIDTQNQSVVLNSGSITNPDNRHSLQFFSKQVREDLLKIENYVNNVSVQIFRTLSSDPDYEKDAIVDGLSGETIKTYLGEIDQTQESAFWDPTNRRAKTLYESLVFIIGKLNDVQGVVGGVTESVDISGLQLTVNTLVAALNTIKETINLTEDQADYTISVTVDNTEYSSIHEALNALSTHIETLLALGGVVELGALNDVNLNNQDTGDVLKYDGSNWINDVLSVEDISGNENLVRENDNVSILENDANYITQGELDVALANNADIGPRGALSVNNIGIASNRNIVIDGGQIVANYGPAPDEYEKANDSITGHLRGIAEKIKGDTLQLERIDNTNFDNHVFRGNDNKKNIVKLVKNTETKFVKRKVFLDLSSEITLDASNAPVGPNSNKHVVNLRIERFFDNSIVEFIPYVSDSNFTDDTNIDYNINFPETNNGEVYYSYTALTALNSFDPLEGNQNGEVIIKNVRLKKITFNIIEEGLIFIEIDVASGNPLITIVP